MLEKIFGGPVPDGYLFSNQDIKKLIMPLIFEQFLAVLVGLLDSIMVSYAGEAAVSGVSLVDCVFILIIQTFAALAAGGAVVAGQYLGMQDKKNGCRAVNQLIIFIVISGILVTALVYLGRNFMLDTVFGRIAPDVRANADTYLLITAASIPFIAIFNAGAALFRAQGNSKLPMKVSIGMNIINVIGNAVLVYGFNMGSAGVAIPTLVSRAFAGIVITMQLTDTARDLHFARPFRLIIQTKMLKNILYIGVPNGFESSMFQFGKIILLSLVSSFGTASITANAIANNVAMFEILPGMATGLAMVAIISQCVGAADFTQVRYYTKKLMKITYASVFVSTICVFALLPLVLKIYSVSVAASRFATIIIVIHGIGSMLLWPFAFAFPNTLRASNDVKFCMVVSTISMFAARVGGGYFCALALNMGVVGVWVAMQFDWVARAAFFIFRYRGTKWQTTRL
jgi:putative MATE family efflux protein